MFFCVNSKLNKMENLFLLRNCSLIPTTMDEGYKSVVYQSNIGISFIWESGDIYRWFSISFRIIPGLIIPNK